MIRKPGGGHPLDRRVSAAEKAQAANTARLMRQVPALMKAAEFLLALEVKQDHDKKTKDRLQELLEALREASLPPGRPRSR